VNLLPTFLRCGRLRVARVATVSSSVGESVDGGLTTRDRVQRRQARRVPLRVQAGRDERLPAGQQPFVDHNTGKISPRVRHLKDGTGPADRCRSSPNKNRGRDAKGLEVVVDWAATCPPGKNRLMSADLVPGPLRVVCNLTRPIQGGMHVDIPSNRDRQIRPANSGPQIATGSDAVAVEPDGRGDAAGALMPMLS